MKSRRAFLEAVTMGAITFPFVKNAFTMNKSDKTGVDNSMLRVAIMGLGSYGTRVAEAMRDCKKAKLTGVISGTPSKIKDWQSKYAISEKNCTIMKASMQ